MRNDCRASTLEDLMAYRKKLQEGAACEALIMRALGSLALNSYMGEFRSGPSLPQHLDTLTQQCVYG